MLLINIVRNWIVFKDIYKPSEKWFKNKYFNILYQNKLNTKKWSNNYYSKDNFISSLLCTSYNSE